ncbi:MAG: hypothetical protein BWY59_00678 [Verrucomicrobia bacterium ADurb.Bin345]|nr:MAG: hypothetical protein BWY59_00678 [Verrucomicrobia bacterium ADurb.Bin345]
MSPCFTVYERSVPFNVTVTTLPVAGATFVSDDRNKPSRYRSRESTGRETSAATPVTCTVITPDTTSVFVTPATETAEGTA